MSETIEFCNICSETRQKCQCSDEDKLKYYHAMRVKTFGIKTVLIEALAYLSMLAKRMEKLENKTENKE